MACGRPAIVFGEGGGPETVVDGETGLVFREPTPRRCAPALTRWIACDLIPATLRARAEAFSRPVFEARFRDFVERALAARETPRATPPC